MQRIAGYGVTTNCEDPQKARKTCGFLESTRPRLWTLVHIERIFTGVVVTRFPVITYRLRLMPLGLPQRSEGLTTTGGSTTSIRRFSSFRPPGPRAGWPKRGKTAKGAREVAFLVANPPLRWGKPSGGGTKSTDRRLVGVWQSHAPCRAPTAAMPAGHPLAGHGAPARVPARVGELHTPRNPRPILKTWPNRARKKEAGKYFLALVGQGLTTSPRPRRKDFLSFRIPRCA